MKLIVALSLSMVTSICAMDHWFFMHNGLDHSMFYAPVYTDYYGNTITGRTIVKSGIVASYKMHASITNSTTPTKMSPKPKYKITREKKDQ